MTSVKFAAATLILLHPLLFPITVAGSFMPYWRYAWQCFSQKRCGVLGHVDWVWTSWAFHPIFHIGSGALLCDPLGHALHRAGPEQALAELRLHLLPWPCAGPLFCASALSRPCCTCSGPEQAWLQLRCSGLVLALADHLCEDRAQHYKFDILVFYFLAYVDLDRLLP